MNNFETFIKHIGIDKNLLQLALTHFSFYEDKNEINGNGRLIFAGMFIFRGQLADILLLYTPGSGTQLQHLLGNLFCSEYLNRLFDIWNLKPKIRASAKFDILAHKHIFVYAIFGCVANLDTENRNRFIKKYFLNSENEHLFNHHRKNLDVKHQANMLSKAIVGKSLITIMSKTEEGLHCAEIFIKNDCLISKAISKSYRYARKKAIKMAIQVLSEINLKDFVNNSDYIERVSLRIEKQKEQKRIELENKIAIKKQKQNEKAEIAKQIKNTREKARRKAKELAKKQKEERAAIAAAKKNKETKAISSRKRRFLEDKLK